MLLVIAVIVLLAPRAVASGLLWVTAAEYWYPPAMAAQSPEDVLSWVLLTAAVIYLGMFVLTLILHQMRIGLTGWLTGWLDDAVSWRDEYLTLKQAFTPLFARAAGVSHVEASEMISRMFPLPEGRRLLTTTRNTEAREALLAWVHLTNKKPTLFRTYVVGRDADDRSGDADRQLRAQLWKRLIDILDEANAGKVRWIIEIATRRGMTENTVQAIDLYLAQHGYPHLVIAPIDPWQSSKLGARISHGNDEWSPHASGRNIVVVLYVDSKPARQADVEITTLGLICAAAPLARIPLYTSSTQLREAKTELEHMAELLALRGFAPGEFRVRDDFTGIVDAKALAQWAVREVVLDTEPASIMGGR